MVLSEITACIYSVDYLIRARGVYPRSAYGIAPSCTPRTGTEVVGDVSPADLFAELLQLATKMTTPPSRPVTAGSVYSHTHYG